MAAKIKKAEWDPHSKNTPSYTKTGLGSRESEAKYHESVAAWMDATGGKQGLEPGAIDYSGGPVPKNKAFEQGFYGHYLPSHFKKTRIIDTYGL